MADMKLGRRLEGKLAVVTAATKGIGFAIAERLAAEGAAVVLSSRKQAQVEEAVAAIRQSCSGARVAGIVCHVAKADHRKALIDFALATFGGARRTIDVLVSNAAVQPVAGPTLEADDGVWEKVFDTNVKSYWQPMKDARPHLKRGSSVVFIRKRHY